MRKWTAVLISLAALFSFIIPLDAHAQSEPGIQNLQIELWPEYDRAAMLVIYRFNLSAGTSLPAQITLRIPAAAGEPHAVAVGAAENQVGDVPFDRQVNGEWADISFTAAMPSVQFEYYDPSIQKNGSQRHYAYQWPGNYPVEFMMMEVQQPFDAAGMSISPSMGTGELRQDGLRYYTSQIGALKDGQTFTIEIDYNKPSDDLTVTKLDVQPSKPLSEDNLGRVQWNSILPWALGFLGLALLGGGAAWYWQSGRRETSTSSRRRQRSRRAVASGTAGGSNIFCHQCGNRAGPGDRFCRSCGTKLRME